MSLQYSSMIMQKLLAQFHKIRWTDDTWATEETIRWWWW